ncbi:hypothetical protein SYNPS1DRAFT_28069 [Syncephalis pseudoplumigaleata]|uniref:Uncharacterized protein n=1 Tax=Syncephalis pseudoplumigaleata TaxID=1712513 RepID=A0A4P9Z1M3_9FUNG|nr:hypothetical protein SYNPS1DRAFT_28069 [Syncephalis pseudoplumigaleata]|eukprot:RKP26225.1 hypothetical protein SYNPS1DRAFT_28069 [Syncephalis pseudoplumigaleata]
MLFVGWRDNTALEEETSFAEQVPRPAPDKTQPPKNEAIVREHLLTAAQDPSVHRSDSKEAAAITMAGQFRLSHARVAASLIEECMHSSKTLTLQRLTASNYAAIESAMQPTYYGGPPKASGQGWMLVAVVAQREPVATSHDGSKSAALVLSDLKYSQCRLTLLDAALEAHWKTAPGSVVAVFNAKTHECGDKIGLAICRAEGMLKLGDSVDFGICSALKRDGGRCKAPIDRRKGAMCEWHCIEGVKRSIARRMEIAVGALLQQHNNLGGAYLQTAKATQHERKKVKLEQEKEASTSEPRKPRPKKSALAILESVKGRAAE